MTGNVIQFPAKTRGQDPWSKAQPTLRDMGDREELWSHPYFGVSQLIWATGSNNVPEPPSPTGGTPAANRVVEWGQLRVAA